MLVELRERGQDYRECPDRKALGLVQYWTGQRDADGWLHGGVSPGLNGLVEAE